MCEPDGLAVNSYVNCSPGLMGGCVTNGTPSMSLGTSWPWKWMPGGLVQVVGEHGPDLVALGDPQLGPGHVPLKPRALMGSIVAVSMCTMGSMVMSKTLVSPSIVGSSGWLP